jgi:hypothetical protein
VGVHFGIYLHALRGSQPASQPAMGGSRGAWLLLLVLSLASVLVCARGQNSTVNGTVSVIANGTANGTTNATVPVYLYPSCDGVEIVYQLLQVVEISPNATNPANQPYRFESNLTVNNKGYSTVDTWGVGFNWVNREVRVFFFWYLQTFPLFLFVWKKIETDLDEVFFPPATHFLLLFC